MITHPSHNTHYSDTSSFDEICTNCGATDRRGCYLLEQPCPSASEVPSEVTDKGRLRIRDGTSLKSTSSQRRDDA